MRQIWKQLIFMTHKNLIKLDLFSKTIDFNGKCLYNS